MSLSSGSDAENPSVEVPMHSAGTKTVRFAATSEVRHVSYPTAEAKQERWYDLEDLCKFRTILACDIHRCSRMLISKSEQCLGISEDESDKSIGIEQFLSCDAKRKIVELSTLKKCHLYVVLMEQARQKHFQIDCVEELERVSERSSHRARQRSIMMASLSTPTLS